MTWNTVQPPIPGRTNINAWYGVQEHHGECYEHYTPSFIQQSVSFTESSSTTFRERLRFWVRGNYDLLDVRIRVYARRTSGAGNGYLQLDVGGNTGSQAVNSGSWAWYEIDVTPSAGGHVQCSLDTSIDSGTTFEVGAVKAYLVGATPGAGILPSGFIRSGGNVWAQLLVPVPSEVVGRTIDGPRCIALDRPRCVVEMLGDVTTGGKQQWMESSVTSYTQVGNFVIPKVDTRSREYTFDAHVIESASGIDAKITVGSVTWDLTGAGDHTTTKVLPPGPLRGTVWVRTGAANTGGFRTLQIWRGSGEV